MLATSMHAQPGVYAALLGSGVSTGAGIPTGWGVVKELVRRIAVASAPADLAALRLAEDDPEAWWVQHGQGELGYSSLLESLAPSAAARQGLLAGFFEPSDDDRNDGLKVPSRAHVALAQLVKRGVVKVILTTNFDRLMEQALEAVGVSAQVISRPEAVNGMAPLAHATATVIKLHGDYKDLGTRNTPAELSEYPAEWNSLLRQVFDEYGLAVCGWSAEWDTALVHALESTPNRRYPLYWDSRSSKGEMAQRLLKARDGNVLPSAGADELFAGLLASVDALDRLAEPPLTTAMAMARVKKYLPDPVRRIDLHDLLMDSADQVATRVSSRAPDPVRLDGEAIEAIYEACLDAVTPLVEMLVTVVWHDSGGDHDALLVDVLQRLIDTGGDTAALEEARLWPALFASTAMGVACVRRAREGLLIRLATEPSAPTRPSADEASSAAQLLHPNALLNDQVVGAMPRWNGTIWSYPSSHILKVDIRRFFADRIATEADYVVSVHGFEYRLGLIQEKVRDGRGYRAVSGEYVGERGWTWGAQSAPLVEDEFRKAGIRSSDWPWQAFLEVDDLEEVLIKHRDVLKNYKRFG